MEPGAALLLHIRPASAVDSKKLDNFSDIDDYVWAADAIDFMYSMNIINTKGDFTYAPQQNIPRGDFAMFLIKALGIDKNTVFEENFSDVDADAEYAAAVATGKKTSILMGVGDDKFNPEAPITRQNLMVICARGMRYKKALQTGDVSSLDVFSDRNLIADYAAADMAAMVRESIVMGNDDGTVNPLGNTTRAEATVIMDRIYKWNN